MLYQAGEHGCRICWPCSGELDERSVVRLFRSSPLSRMYHLGRRPLWRKLSSCRTRYRRWATAERLGHSCGTGVHVLPLNLI